MKAVAIRHVRFEDLGSLEPVLRSHGFQIEYWEAGLDDLKEIDTSVDLVIMLGGPIGAYEEEKYPFLLDEVRLAEFRLRSRRPTLGICLGAQIMARALGARVYPGGRKEIGWGSVELTQAGIDSPLAALASTRVLHWHGDTFDLPVGTARLASTSVYENQSFCCDRALALQFHAELQLTSMERWYIGHACELATTKDLSLSAIRNDGREFAPILEAKAPTLWLRWLSTVLEDRGIDLSGATKG